VIIYIKKLNILSIILLKREMTVRNYKGILCENTYSNFTNFVRIVQIRGRIRRDTVLSDLTKYKVRGRIRGRSRNILEYTEAFQHILKKKILLVKIIFRLILLNGIAIIVIAFYMRIYCHDHTSLSTQTPNINSLIMEKSNFNKFNFLTNSQMH
jgi:hypothetical protein